MARHPASFVLHPLSRSGKRVKRRLACEQQPTRLPLPETAREWQRPKDDFTSSPLGDSFALTSGQWQPPHNLGRAKDTHSPRSLHGASARPAGNRSFLSAPPLTLQSCRASAPPSSPKAPPASCLVPDREPEAGLRPRGRGGADPAPEYPPRRGHSSWPTARVRDAPPSSIPRLVLAAGLACSRCPSAGRAPEPAQAQHRWPPEESRWPWSPPG